MSYQVTWNKSQRDKAKADGLALWAVGYEDEQMRGEYTGLMEHGKAKLLFRFATAIYGGMEPDEAFEFAKKRASEL